MAHRPKVILKLVSTASGGTECCVQAGEVFVMTHLYKTGHGLCWKADEVQVPCSATHRQVPQLQVDIPNTCFTLGDAHTFYICQCWALVHIMMMGLS